VHTPRFDWATKSSSVSAGALLMLARACVNALRRPTPLAKSAW
jgi:hypothetical protein